MDWATRRVLRPLVGVEHLRRRAARQRRRHQIQEAGPQTAGRYPPGHPEGVGGDVVPRRTLAVRAAFGPAQGQEVSSGSGTGARWPKARARQNVSQSSARRVLARAGRRRRPRHRVAGTPSWSTCGNWTRRTSASMPKFLSVNCRFSSAPRGSDAVRVVWRTRLAEKQTRVRVRGVVFERSGRPDRVFLRRRGEGGPGSLCEPARRTLGGGGAASGGLGPQAREAQQVVGEHGRLHPGLEARQAAPTAARESEAALQVGDARLGAGAEPLEHAVPPRRRGHVLAPRFSAKRQRHPQTGGRPDRCRARKSGQIYLLSTRPRRTGGRRDSVPVCRPAWCVFGALRPPALSVFQRFHWVKRKPG